MVILSNFGKKLEIWMLNSLDLHSNPNFTICEVLFGNKPKAETQMNKLINIIITIAKWYLNQCRTNKKELNFTSFLSIVREKLNIYKCIFRAETEGVKRDLYRLLIGRKME